MKQMSNILDSKTISDLKEKWVQKVKLFFYNAGCSGTKVDMLIDDFESDSLVCVEPGDIQIYTEEQDTEKFQGARITRVVKADHTGEEQARYIYSNEAVLDRCGCGTSFSFEKKKVTIDLDKLKDLKKFKFKG